MARVTDKMIICNELRPCEVNNAKESFNALFHKWTVVTEEDGTTYPCAIVENTDTGTVNIVVAESVKFLDDKADEYFSFPEEGNAPSHISIFDDDDD